MAYYHLKGGTSTSTSYIDNFLNDLKDIFHGTITTTSGLDNSVWNRDASSIHGTHPSSGIYSWTTSDVSSSTMDDNAFYGIKYHYAKGGTGVDSNYNPSCRLYANGSTSYSAGLSFHIRNSQGANGGLATSAYRPSGNSSSTASSAGYYPYFTSPGNSTTGWNDVYIIRNDTTFAINIVGGNGANYFFMITDFEYMDGADEHLNETYNNYCPHGMMTAGTYKNMDVDDAGLYQYNSSNPSYYGFYSVYTPNYVNPNGTMRTPSKNMYSSFSYDSDSGTYMKTNPEAWQRVAGLPASGGGLVRPMVPLRMYNTIEGGYSSSEQYAMTHPKLCPNVYRVDDNGYANGDVILDGSTKYRVLRVHKTGDKSGYFTTNNKYTACYAFPEDNVAYG